jgi:hypothetical protein
MAHRDAERENRKLQAAGGSAVELYTVEEVAETVRTSARFPTAARSTCCPGSS